ncbi:methyl-accepting chemotaxis protein [Amaricoccus macauensis]|uniref:methyl-accepting chemotaxis protein n=1 Tax=Amaricoccus macauensis TaxID=57001 RepID=UPI003C7E8D7A
MSLNTRIFAPILTVVLAGVISFCWLAWRAIEVGQASSESTEQSVEILAQATRISTNADHLSEILDDLLGMTRLYDTDAAWGRFSEIAEDMRADVERIGVKAQSEAMRALVIELEETRAMLVADAGLVFGIAPAPAIPTAEKLNRHTAHLAGLVAAVNAQASTDAQAVAAENALVLRDQITMAGALGGTATLAAVIFAGIIAMSLSRHMRRIASELQVMSGTGTGTDTAPRDRPARQPRNEILTMLRALDVLKESLASRDALAAQALEHEKARAEQMAAEQRRAEEDAQRMAEEQKRVEAQIAAERQQAAEQARRAAAFATFEDALARTVAAASNGDFSARVPTESPDPALASIAEQLNALLQGTEAAITELSHVLNGFASGDLTYRMRGSYKGLLASLQKDANTTGDKLRSLVQDIQNSARQINSSIFTISNGAGDLSSRATEQAGNLERTSSSMEEIASTVKATAENAAHAQALSETARTEAANGAEIAERAMAAIRLVEVSASKIAEITSVVDGIAFQTNLLALNAGVEAARAGEAGKGFTIVASEVRALAQRAADAAREIAALTAESSEQVSQGVTLVENTGNALSKISRQVETSAQAISDIFEAAQAQSSAVAEISQDVTELKANTQKNVHLAVESADVARGVAAEADQLTDLMSFFKVGNGAVHPHAGRAAG